MFVGVGAARVRGLFQTARKQAPAYTLSTRSTPSAARGPLASAADDGAGETLNQMLSDDGRFETNRRRS